MKRKASILCYSAGTTGRLSLHLKTPSGMSYTHDAHGAKVRVVTDRFSGLEVEFIGHHKYYRDGARIVVGRDDFTTGATAELVAVFETLNRKGKLTVPKKGRKKTTA